MAKYHIDINGNPAVCKAKKRVCPRGGEETHFDSKEDAQAFSDKVNEERFGSLAVERNEHTVEGYNEEYERLLEEESNLNKKYLIDEGYGLDVLVYDDNPAVRITALRKAIELNHPIIDKIKHSIDPQNQYELARRGIDPAHFARSQYSEVRREVASAGKEADYLVNDKDPIVRLNIAKSNLKFDELMNDEDDDVRWEVYKRGHKIEEFKNDKDFRIRQSLARKEMFLDQYVNDENDEVRREVAKTGQYLDELKDDPSEKVRREVAKQGHALDILINDDDDYVRVAVAKHKFGLDKLAKDPSFRVRREVLVQNDWENWRDFVDDESVGIRENIAERGHALDILMYDDEVSVRVEVARQGYGLNELIDDKSKQVRDVAQKKLGLPKE